MSTATLLVRCVGPMQSWGTRSRFRERDTEREPSKSGVIGLLAAALGRRRHEPVEDLAGLRMAVRIDRPGRVEVDYQTALGVAKASGATPETLPSHRHYLADADFLVGLEGDRALLGCIHEALRSPRWPLFLGRRGYVPGLPPYVPDGMSDEALVDALRGYPWPTERGAPPDSLAVVEECAGEDPGSVRWDVPISFASADRRYATRRVKRTQLDRPAG